MRDVGAVQAVDAVRSEDALLYLQHSPLLVPLSYKEAKLLLYRTYFIHEVIDLVEFVTAGLGMEIEPNVFYVLADEVPVSCFGD